MTRHSESYSVQVLAMIANMPIGDKFTSMDITQALKAPKGAAAILHWNDDRPACITPVGTAPGKGSPIIWEHTYSPVVVDLDQTIQVINTGGAPNPRPGPCGACSFGTDNNLGCPDVEAYQHKYTAHRNERIDIPYAQILGQVATVTTTTHRARPPSSPLAKK